MSLLTIENKGAVQLISLNRPEKGNSLTDALVTDLHAAIKAVYQSQHVHTLIIQGAGTRFFCTGADLNELKQTEKGESHWFKLYLEIIQFLEKTSLFTASFVGGDCIGAGLGLAQSTDFVLAKVSARFGTPEIKSSLFPFLVSGPLLRKLSPNQVFGLCFGGKLRSGDEAKELGLVSEMVEASAFESRCDELRQLWNEAPAQLIRDGKSALRNPQSEESLLAFLSLALKEFRKL